MTEAMYDVITNKYLFKVSNELVTMATAHNSFFYKIQDNFPSYEQSYSLPCWIWRKNGKISTVEVPILLVTVYVARSNKRKQLY